MKKLKTRIEYDIIIKELDQYDIFDGEEMFQKHNKYSEPIGMFLIAFSRLEWFLNYMIMKSINDRGDEPGLRVLKYLEVGDRIDFFHGQYRRLVASIDNLKTKDKEKEKLKIIISKLEEISEFRNKIAHANWITLDKNHFVRIDVKENKADGTVYFKYAKITPGIIKKFITQTDLLARFCSSFLDRMDSVLGRV